MNKSADRAASLLTRARRQRTRRLGCALLLGGLACLPARAEDAGRPPSGPVPATRTLRADAAPGAAGTSRTSSTSGTPAAEQRLEAVRNALADEALKGPVRVQAVAWIDEGGQLRESLQIRSDLKLRGVRVLSYLEDPAAPDPAQPAAPAGNAAAASGASATSGTSGASGTAAAAPAGTPAPASTASATPAARREAACPATDSRFKRHAMLLTERYGGTLNTLGLLPELAQRARAALREGFQHSQGWVLTAGSPAPNAYDRALAGRDASVAAPYSLQLVLQETDAPAPAAPQAQDLGAWLRRTAAGNAPRELAPRRIQLGLRLTESMSGRLLWSRQGFIDFPALAMGYGQPRWPASVDEALARLLGGWRTALQESLACEPQQFVVQAAPDGEQLLVQAGSRIGLRNGDQLLLVDRARFAQRVLEAGVLENAALVEIVATHADQAVARRVSGPAPGSDLRHLMAVPL